MKSFHPLIYAYEAENITIKGRGRLEGNGRAWWEETWRLETAFYKGELQDAEPTKYQQAWLDANPGFSVEPQSDWKNTLARHWFRPFIQLYKCKNILIEVNEGGPHHHRPRNPQHRRYQPNPVPMCIFPIAISASATTASPSNRVVTCKGVTTPLLRKHHHLNCTTFPVMVAWLLAVRCRAMSARSPSAIACSTAPTVAYLKSTCRRCSRRNPCEQYCDEKHSKRGHYSKPVLQQGASGARDRKNSHFQKHPYFGHDRLGGEIGRIDSGHS